jgi:hypothetical protein
MQLPTRYHVYGYSTQRHLGLVDILEVYTLCRRVRVSDLRVFSPYDPSRYDFLRLYMCRGHPLDFLVIGLSFDDLLLKQDPRGFRAGKKLTHGGPLVVRLRSAPKV